MAKSEWDSIQEKFGAFGPEDSDCMLDYFNSVSAQSMLGEALFGEGATYYEFEVAINGLDEQTQKNFVTAWNDAIETQE